MAVLTGLMLRRTLLRGDSSPLILELPAYHRPSLARLYKETWIRVRYFISRAFFFITPVCMILGILNSVTIEGSIHFDSAAPHSLLSYIGQSLTPLFSPMGIHADNWPATVGLLTGTIAKEVVVGSMNTLYANMGNIAESVPIQFDFFGAIQTALWSIPHNLAELGRMIVNPLASHVSVATDAVQPVYGIMYQHFDGQAGAYAYLLFILLYIPCVSTMAAIRQEAGRRLMWFSISWSLLIAYATAVSFYQLATIAEHPQQTLTYLGVIVTCITLTIMGLRLTTFPIRGAHVTANP
jgi:ferrous iron transport protein B